MKDSFNIKAVAFLSRFSDFVNLFRTSKVASCKGKRSVIRDGDSPIYNTFLFLFYRCSSVKSCLLRFIIGTRLCLRVNALRILLKRCCTSGSNWDSCLLNYSLSG